RPKLVWRSSSLILTSSEDYPITAVIDTVHGFAYYGTRTATGVIVKVRLSDFTRVGQLYLNPNENYLSAAAIDVAGGFAYFGTGTFSGTVVKVRLSDLTRVGAISLPLGENVLTSAVIDPAGGFVLLWRQHHAGQGHQGAPLRFHLGGRADPEQWGRTSSTLPSLTRLAARPTSARAPSPGKSSR
ncbi:MAG: hypothetical protein IPN59_13925, partial [Holophaga sp.]|nr:hypothetical protein [Holophaga sp.]